MSTRIFTYWCISVDTGLHVATGSIRTGHRYQVPGTIFRMQETVDRYMCRYQDIQHSMTEAHHVNDLLYVLFQPFRLL